MKALIVLNGPGPGRAALRAAARKARWVIAADGGAAVLAAAGLEADRVIGDFDSLPRGLEKRWRKAVFTRDARQDRSDLEKALALAKRLGARELLISGARGGGLDHELVNAAVLERAGLPVALLGSADARLLGPGRHRLALPRGARFSLLGAPRAKVRLSGGRWGLAGETLGRGSRGLGNRAEGPVSLSVLSGRLWLIVPAALLLLAAAAPVLAQGYDIEDAVAGAAEETAAAYRASFRRVGLVQAYMRLIHEHPLVVIPATLGLLGLAAWIATRKSENAFLSKSRGGFAARKRSATAKDREHLDAIKARDPRFDESAFLERCAAAHAVLRAARLAGDLGAARLLVSDGVYERLDRQLADRRARGRPLEVEGGELIDAEILRARAGRRFDALWVRMSASAEGEPHEEVWTFLRRPGAKTLAGKGALVRLCPSCGAPLAVSDAAKCGACGAWATSGDHDWVLTETTHASEWVLHDPERDVEGFSAVAALDPDLSLAALEDRASVLFWRLLATDEGVPPPSDCEVGAVETTAFDARDGAARAHVAVRWSGRASPAAPAEVRRHFLILERALEARTDARQGLRTARCPSCGGPASGRDEPECAYCGKTLQDRSKDWVLADAVPFGEWSRPGEKRGELRGLDWGAELSPADAYSVLAGVMLADGDYSLAERGFLEGYARSRGIPREKADEIVAAARAGKLDAPRPQGGEEADAVLRGMIRACLADGVITPAERSAIESFGGRFALGPGVVAEMVAEERRLLHPNA